MRKAFLIIFFSQLLGYAISAEEPAVPSCHAGALEAIQREIAEIGSVLERNNVAIDVDSLKDKLAQALIQAIDSKSVIVTESEAERILTAECGTDNPDATGSIEEWPQQIGYIKLKGLYKDSGEQVAAQLRAWVEGKYFGVILDMRDAGGRSLVAVAQIAGLFANSGEHLFAVLDGKGAALAEYRAENGKALTMPMMVLVNRGTEGAAEALAAVLKNRGGVLLIGSATAGDNRIRKAVPLDDGRMLYIATSRIDLKDGRAYGGKGVIPDMAVVKTDAKPAGSEVSSEQDEEYSIFSGWSEEERDHRELMKRIGDDSDLKMAADILLGLKALRIRMK